MCAKSKLVRKYRPNKISENPQVTLDSFIFDCNDSIFLKKNLMYYIGIEDFKYQRKFVVDQPCNQRGTLSAEDMSFLQNGVSFDPRGSN